MTTKVASAAHTLGSAANRMRVSMCRSVVGKTRLDVM